MKAHSGRGGPLRHARFCDTAMNTNGPANSLKLPTRLISLSARGHFEALLLHSELHLPPVGPFSNSPHNHWEMNEYYESEGCAEVVTLQIWMNGWKKDVTVDQMLTIKKKKKKQRKKEHCLNRIGRSQTWMSRPLSVFLSFILYIIPNIYQSYSQVIYKNYPQFATKYTNSLSAFQISTQCYVINGNMPNTPFPFTDRNIFFVCFFCWFVFLFCFYS